MKTLFSRSSDNKIYSYKIDLQGEKEKIDAFVNKRPTVVIQGLGFVGAAVLVAVANAKNRDRVPLYSVIGVDLPDQSNYWKIAKVLDGHSPILTSDNQLERHYQRFKKSKNVYATYSSYAYEVADIVVIDINLDVQKRYLGDAQKYNFSYNKFIKAVNAVAARVKENALIVLETTVPPGTTEQLVYPLFKQAFIKRKLDISKISIVHSYERVMPGKDYLNSITDFYRVYAGIDLKSCKRARHFFKSFVNTKKFPLVELHSPTASEMGKILENSYRAMNIAFIQEWTDFAQRAGVDLFAVLEAIRLRPTHANIMSPGFGVGGYCLPKDPLLADWSYKKYFGSTKRLEMSLEAVNINDQMPLYAFDLLKENISNLNGKRILLLGVCYQADVADTRYSPTELFFDQCRVHKMDIAVHDPLVSYWPEKHIDVETNLKKFISYHQDILVFTVRHKEYQNLTAKDITTYFPGVKWILDANNVVNDRTAFQLRCKGINCFGIGKGHWRTNGR